jgi:lipoprotein-anchoring transpeptidase ErfK/SrfK
MLPVGTGRRGTPTPLGRFTIVTKVRHPWWYPPAADWAESLDPIPPGPGNPLGTRWMGISARAVGIHGTPDAPSVGYSRSHGCVRMYSRQAEWLFRRVRVGTPVLIVRA